jgi:translation initiation factor IF-3
LRPAGRAGGAEQKLRGFSIARRPFPAPPQRELRRINNLILVEEVRLIDADGEMLGVYAIDSARQLAEEAGLDLVEVSPNAEPPVCKILDYGKYKYEDQKRKAVARKKQKTVDVKEIKMRPGIDSHDYDVKMRAMTRFLDEGDKVKVTLRFRGREMAHQELGLKVLHRVVGDIEELGKVEQMPRMEGRQMTMVVAPLK